MNRIKEILAAAQLADLLEELEMLETAEKTVRTTFNKMLILAEIENRTPDALKKWQESGAPVNELKYYIN